MKFSFFITLKNTWFMPWNDLIFFNASLNSLSHKSTEKESKIVQLLVNSTNSFRTTIKWQSKLPADDKWHIHNEVWGVGEQMRSRSLRFSEIQLKYDGGVCHKLKLRILTIDAWTILVLMNFDYAYSGEDAHEWRVKLSSLRGLSMKCQSRIGPRKKNTEI